MYYTEKEARRLVVEAGNRLIADGLAFRTWGNISARISPSEFIITPSGLAYDLLTEDDLVLVHLSDLSYEDDKKPSSEKGIHANAYTLRENISFIIHTHQPYASAVGINDEAVSFVNGDKKITVPCAEYGLPGTKRLCENVSKVIKFCPNSNAFFMHRHGALVLGTSYEEAFEIANTLEENCKKLFEEKTNGKKVSEKKTLKPWLDDFAQIYGAKNISDDDKEALEKITWKNKLAALFANEKAKPLGFIDSKLQKLVYTLKYSKQKDKK